MDYEKMEDEEDDNFKFGDDNFVAGRIYINFSDIDNSDTS